VVLAQTESVYLKSEKPQGMRLCLEESTPRDRDRQSEFGAQAAPLSSI
jgi:hypothetical protein